MPLNQFYYKFEIGDIVRENDVIAFYDESPMLGVVVGIVRDRYCFYDEILPIYQDELTIKWITIHRVEILPSDLVHLVSHAQK